jgi:DNA replication licensing factor MCM7
MECSKESLQEDGDKEFEPDKSVTSQIFRLIKAMAGPGGDKQDKRKQKRKERRFGKGPGRERDMDVDDDDDDFGGDAEELSLIDIRARVVNAGFTEAQLMETISAVSLAFVPHCYSI